EHVFLAAVLADQGGGQAKAAAGLDLGRDAEDRRRQQVDFIIDNQAPIPLVEDLEVRELFLLVRPVRQDLIGGDGHRTDLLHFARVFGDVAFLEVRLVEDLADPLFDGGDARGQHQRRFLHESHGGDADDGLAGPAGQDNDAAAAASVAPRVKNVGGFAL